MNISIIILGILQGFTEFLPVSSSGHLLLSKYLFKLQLPLIFDILLHIATMFAVLVFTFPIITNLIRTLIRYIQYILSKYRSQSSTSPSPYISLKDKRQMHIIVCLIISTLTTAPIGLALKQIVINASLLTTSIAFYCTGLILVLPFLIPAIAKRIHISTSSTSTSDDSAHTTTPTINTHIPMVHAIILGLVQGIAVLPGISRSGITISVGVLLGLNYKDATKYSFLLAIPAILASFLTNMDDIPSMITQISPLTLVMGLAITFICGLIGLKGLSIIAHKKKIWYFSPYLLIIGSITLFIALK